MASLCVIITSVWLNSRLVLCKSPSTSALVLDEEAGDENAPRFPETLGILLQKLDQNEFAHRVFGEKFCRMYGEGKKEEWERFCAYVTDWETAEYLYRC